LPAPPQEARRRRAVRGHSWSSGIRFAYGHRIRAVERGGPRLGALLVPALA
jgi:hypothetical protein